MYTDTSRHAPLPCNRFVVAPNGVPHSRGGCNHTHCNATPYRLSAALAAAQKPGFVAKSHLPCCVQGKLLQRHCMQQCSTHMHLAPMPGPPARADLVKQSKSAVKAKCAFHSEGGMKSKGSTRLHVYCMCTLHIRPNTTRPPEAGNSSFLYNSCIYKIARQPSVDCLCPCCLHHTNLFTYRHSPYNTQTIWCASQSQATHQHRPTTHGMRRAHRSTQGTMHVVMGTSALAESAH